MKQKFTLLILLLLFFCHDIFSQNVGEAAPDFTLKTLGEMNYTLSQNRGKVVFVFLVGYNCSLCIASAPTVKSEIIDANKSNPNFQALIIDTWDGSSSAFNNFKSTTNLSGTYLQKGSAVASNWSTTYDRVVVIDAEGTMVFKGNSAASSDAEDAAVAIRSALSNVATPVTGFADIEEFTVSQNYPNPCSNRTKIDFSLSEPAYVKLSVIDITGKVVNQPISNYRLAGTYTFDLNTSELRKGIYFYRFEAGEFLSMKKMIVN